MLFKNVASQKIHVYAYDSTTGAAKTGDAANITAYVSLDGTANAIDDTNPAEVDATNMPGVYVFDLAQAETNCNSFALYARSSTSNIRLEPIIGFTTGAAVTQTGDAYARLGAPAGASHAADVAAVKVDTAAVKAKTDSLTFTVAGDLDVNVQSWAGASVATPSVAGVPEVDLTHVGGAAASGVATVDANVTTIENGAITAAAIATGAIDADALAADAGTEIGAAVKTAIEAAGSHLTLILEDTGTTLPATLSTILTDTDELQKAITDGGRTDLLIDAIKAKTDAMLDAAATRTAVGLASANLDTQLSGINSKTTNLPSDPAGQSAVEAAIAAVQSHGDSTWATATSVMVSDKAGFKLASDGLDSVATTAPTGPAANFREMIVQTWRRFFKRSTRTYSGGTQQIVTYADNGTTPVTTQTISDDGTTETQGVAS